MVFPGGTSGKEPICQCSRLKRHRFDPWVGKIPWRRGRQLMPVFLPGESHGQKSLAGYSPWGREELDMTEQLSMHVGWCCSDVMWVCVSGCLPWAGQLGLGRSLWYRNELRTGGSSLQRGHMKTITWEISGWSRMSRAKGGNRELHGAM